MSDIAWQPVYWDRVGEGLVWIGLTLLAYMLFRNLQQRLNGNPLINPVLLASAVIIGLMMLSGRDYDHYNDGGQWLLWILGPATVSLAIPLYLNFRQVRSVARPMFVALLAGSLTAVLSAVLIGMALGASPETISSLAPKSVTTPIAMGIADQIGGIPALAAVFVIFTGAIGAVFGSWIFNALGIKDPRARGFAMGIAAHGIGTARAFQVSWEAGTFSGVAMTLNGIITALLLPVIWLLFS
ncbi:MAG: LrgB family protein [Rhizobiales bacterium]|nr:LrgB family protein [Hyphomicrobiales bacterium]